jgi:hypothetical protein
MRGLTPQSNNINIDRVFDGIVRQLRKVHQGQLVQVKEKKKKWRSKCVFL